MTRDDAVVRKDGRLLANLSASSTCLRGGFSSTCLRGSRTSCSSSATPRKGRQHAPQGSSLVEAPAGPQHASGRWWLPPLVAAAARGCGRSWLRPLVAATARGCDRLCSPVARAGGEPWACCGMQHVSVSVASRNKRQPCCGRLVRQASTRLASRVRTLTVAAAFCRNSLQGVAHVEMVDGGQAPCRPHSRRAAIIRAFTDASAAARHRLPSP